MKSKISLLIMRRPFRIILTSVTVRLLLIFVLSPVPSALSQTPQGFNYQAIARDASGNPLAGISLPVRITIQSSSTGGTLFWQELHSAVTSNSFGLITLVAGTGTRLVASTVPAFDAIDWSVLPKYIRTEVDYNGWKDMGATPLWSVPYAMVAEELGGPVKKLSVSGETISPDEALFDVKNRDGQTVFAVYNEGVRVYVADGTKGIKGGFAVGGFGDDKAESQKYLVVSKDSVRIYLDTNPLTKGIKGGFAVGGFDLTKQSVIEDYLQVTRDSTRIYVKEPLEGKGIKGGFAVGGFDVSGKGQNITPFTSLTPDNYFIGHNSGWKNLTGRFNSFVGYETGYENKAGSYNSLFGFRAGYNNATGSGNLFLGYESGYSNTEGSYNTFMGYRSGYKNSTGDKNSFLGSFTGENNTSGGGNTFSGIYAGNSNTTGSNNIFMGPNSGFSNTEGNNNVFIGAESGQYNISGNYNTFLGYRAGNVNNANNNVFIGHDCGYRNTTGNVNVFIGYAAGSSNTTGSGNIFLGNGSGLYNLEGSSNVFLGERAGFQNDYGRYNVYIGSLAGFSGTTAESNVFIGYLSGNAVTYGSSNVFVGEMTGRRNTTGSQNVFIGDQAGESNIAGTSNVLIGTGAGQKANASDNIFLGFGSGFATTSGYTNVYIGNQAGFNNTTGQSNVFIGNGTGYSNLTGTGNVFLGKNAGWYETGSDKLYIDNSWTTTPLIYGDFNLNSLTINGTASITGAASVSGTTTLSGTASVNGTYLRIGNNPGTAASPEYYLYQGSSGSTVKQYALAVNDALWVTGPSFLDGSLDINVSGGSALSVAAKEALWFNGTYFSWGYGGTYNYFARKVTIGNVANPGTHMLYVQGTAYSTGGFIGSDARWKKDFENLNRMLPDILKIDGVKYNWRTEEYPEMNFEKERQIGLVAQDIEKIFPELVRTDENGYKAVSYEKLSVILLEGMKEQQQQIESQQKQLDELKALISGMIAEKE